MRKGVGRELVNDMMAFADELEIGRIEVTGNPDSLDFYRAVGFVVDYETPTELGTGLRMHLEVIV